MATTKGPAVSTPYPAKFIIERERVITENGNKPHGFGQIDIDNFVPYPKNPLIARVFKEIGWAEELASGIRNIKKYSKIYSDSKTVFIEGDVFMTIISVKEVDKNIVMTDKKSKTEYKSIIEYLHKNEYITNMIVRKLLGLTDTTAKRLLNRMVVDLHLFWFLYLIPDKTLHFHSLADFRNSYNTS